MIANPEIYRIVNRMIERYGAEVTMEAAVEACNNIQADDLVARAVWLQVAEVIEELLSDSIPEDVTVH